MKQLFKTFFIGSVITAASFSAANATIWRLNNSNGNTLTPNVNASFPVATTLQAAHNNAGVLSGDTIHVEQSNTSYGSLVMTKKLTIIGAGYFLSMNPKTQVNTSFGSPVDNIDMTASTCAGSTVTGLTIGGYVNAGTNRLLIARNYFNYAYNTTAIRIGSGGATNIDSVVISQNYIATSTFSYAIGSLGGTTGNVTNAIISNNYIGGYYGSVLLSGNVSGIIKNNIITTDLSVYNMYVVNNIGTGGTYTFYNSVIEYNLGTVANRFTGTIAGTGNTIGTGNIMNATPGFTGGAGSTDGAWALLSTSPAKLSGKSGDDMGIFGSSLPYVLSGIPTVPNVYALTIAPIGAGATTISVTVSTKSN